MDEFEELDGLFEAFGIPAEQSHTYTAVNISEQLSQEFEGSDSDEDLPYTEEIVHARLLSRDQLFPEFEDIIRNYETVNTRESDSDRDTDGVTGNDNNICSCKVDCSLQFEKNIIESHILSMREMDRNEAEMFIMGSVQQIGTDETLKGKHRKRTRFRYTFQGKPVCKKAFTYINDIGSKPLRNIVDQVPRTHGNTGRKPHHALGYNEIRFCVDWITWFADINGLPTPAAPRVRDGEAPILLPSNLTKGCLHSQYSQACEEANVRKLGVSSFKNAWKNCIPHIKIMSPKDDVCCKCEQLRHNVMDAVTEQAKLDAATCLRERVQDAQTERQVYQTAVVQAREEMAGYVRQTVPVTPLSADFNKVHVTFDYSQSVTIPHHSRQMGPMYFVTGRKINMFGVRIDSTSEQFNYLIDEGQSIGLDGTGTHGPNSVISMLHHCLQNYGFGEKGLHLHTDNCGGQNKNRYTLAYLCWRVNTGLHEHITLNMAIPGHTKYDWKSFFTQFFLQVKGIQKYHSFRFSVEDKSAVFVRERSGSDEIRVPLTKRNTEVPIATFPEILQPAGLSRERSNVRKYVRPAYQDDTCPACTEE